MLEGQRLLSSNWVTVLGTNNCNNAGYAPEVTWGEVWIGIDVAGMQTGGVGNHNFFATVLQVEIGDLRPRGQARTRGRDQGTEGKGQMILTRGKGDNGPRMMSQG